MRSERLAGGGVLGLLSVIFVLNLAWIVGNCEKLRPPQRGEAAPPFSLARADGAGRVRLEDLRGRIVLLDFWATWCGPCQATMPILEDIHRTYAQRGVVLVSVNTDGGADRADKALAFARRLGLSFPVYLDDGVTSAAYHVDTIPHMVILDREGRIRDVHVGFLTKDGLRSDLEETIRALLAESP